MKLQVLLSKREAADALGVSLRMLDYLIARKELSVTRIGRRVLVLRKTVEEFARGR